MNLINIEHISKIYGEKVIFDDASFGVQQGDKIGIVGINGTGKSTLLKVVAGEEVPDEGQVVRQNGLKIAFVPQNPTFPEGMDIRSYALQDADAESWQVESNLTELGITQWDQKIDTLSGGQKRRVVLAKILAGDFDVLLLDEPTNHLDQEMISWLEDYLRSYRGTVLMVTHDRYFLDRTMKRIFAFEGDGKLKQYEGGYTDYVNRLAAEGRTPGGNIAARSAGADISGNSQNQKSEESVIEKNDSTATWKQKKKLKFSYKEQKEYETIEDDIAALEQKLEDLDNEMAANATNAAKLRELVEEKENAEKMLEEKMDRWEYLEELAAKIAGQQS